VALALPLLGLLMLPKGGLSSMRKPGLSWLLLAGGFFAGDLAVWHQSIRLTSVANATLLANVAPVFVALASFLIFGERFRAGFIAGLGLALGGAAVLVSNSLRLGHGTALGDVCGMIAALFYSGYLLVVSRERSRYSTIEVMFWTTLMTAVLLLPMTLLFGETLLPQSLGGWLVLLGLALLSHVLGQGLIAYALAHLPTSFSAVGLLVQPVAAAIFAWTLLGEAFAARQVVGGAIVLVGVVTCRLTMSKR
jgi:drug/metabolite transporter (DMT)-like permease